MKKGELFSEKSKTSIRDQVIGFIICTIIYGICSWIAPQIKISLNLTNIIIFSFFLYITLGVEAINRFINGTKITEISIIQRIVGGIFWLAIGLLIIENQINGRIDASVGSIMAYTSGVMFILVGVVQIFGRFELAIEAINLVIYGEKYRAQKKLKQILSESVDDMDDEYRLELMSKVMIKLDKLRKEGKIDAIVFKQIQEFIKEDEKLSFNEFSQKYFGGNLE